MSAFEQNSLTSPEVDDCLHSRDNLPPAFQYGRVETISIAPLQKYRSPDTGNGSYIQNQQIIFYLETGGAAFLNTNELYITFTCTVTAALSEVPVGTVLKCQLDYNTDAFFYESQLQVNGNLTEHLIYLNMFCNIVDTLENGTQSYVEYIQAPVTQNVNITNNIPSTGVYTAVIDEYATNQQQLYQGWYCISNPSLPWIGQHKSIPRQGAALMALANNATNTTTGTSGHTYSTIESGVNSNSVQLAYHIKSFQIGVWAKQFFPLAFVNQLQYTLITDTNLKVLKNTTYIPTYTGATPVNTDTVLDQTDVQWSYSLSAIRLHYVLNMVQDEVASHVQKAYLQNSLPDFISSVRTYTWQQATPLATGTTSVTSTFTLSGTSFDKLIFVHTRAGDFSLQMANSISSFVGGVQYFQVKVNGQCIPTNRIDTGAHSYELFRQLAYAYGSKNFNINNINTAAYAAPVQGTGYVGNNGYIYPLPDASDESTGTADSVGGGLCSPDEWNAPVLSVASSDDPTIDNRQQGCTIFVVSLSDVLSMAGQNVKGGIAIRGMNVFVDETFNPSTDAALNLHCFAVQDELLIMKGTSVAVLS